MNHRSTKFTLPFNSVKIIKVMIFGALILSINSVLAQKAVTVKGVIMGADKELLVGATVVVKNTTLGVSTDYKGQYSISAKPTDVLSVSYMGYDTKEIKVGNSTILNIQLNPSAINLDDLVVIGYGTMKKKDLTGAVVSANLHQLESTPTTNVADFLRGSVPGLNVTRVAGRGEGGADASPVIEIRGRTSLSGSQEPLIVLDGIIYRGSLNTINTADIASIDVLKDASSTAIYGSEAANGVIIITTKEGKQTGKPIISFNASYSLQESANTLRPMNSKQWMEKNRDWDWKNSYLQDPTTGQWSIKPGYKYPKQLNQDEIDLYEKGVDYDWWNALSDNPSIQEYNLSLNGNSQYTKYYVSAGYISKENFIKGDNYSRAAFRVNLETKLTDWATFGIRANANLEDVSGETANMQYAMMFAPIATPYDADGKLSRYPYWRYNTSENPLWTYENDDLEKNLMLSGSGILSLTCPWIKGLSYRGTYTYNANHWRHYNYNPSGWDGLGMAKKMHSNSNSYMFDNTFNYKRTIAKDHRVDATFVYGREFRQSENTDLKAGAFPSHELGWNKLSGSQQYSRDVDSGAWQESSIFYMGRLFYSFKDKYMFTGTIRRDGFSGYGADNKWGIFPSAALAWTMSQESFIKDNVKWIDNLKLRISYGLNGNRSVSRYQTLATVVTGGDYTYGDNVETGTGKSVGQMANEDLRWEKTAGLNVGLDFAFLKSRLFGNVEIYNNQTIDMLYQVPVPSMNGVTTVMTNIGEMRNHGIEISVTGVPIQNKNWRWQSTLTFSRNRDKLVSLLGRDDDGDGREDDLIDNKLFIGKPLDVVYDYKNGGMWQLEDEAGGRIPSGFYPGTNIVVDTDGQEGITASDKTIIGYSSPAFRWSWSNTVNWKHFELSFMLNSCIGSKDRYLGNANVREKDWWKGGTKALYVNMPKWDYWTPANPNAAYPRLDQSASFRPGMVQRKDFVRLQNLTFAYTFSEKILSKVGINSLRLYFTGQNLFTLTGWDGWDPESETGYQINTRPLMRSYSFGINFSF